MTFFVFWAMLGLPGCVQDFSVLQRAGATLKLQCTAEALGPQASVAVAHRLSCPARPRDATHVPCIARRILYHWTTQGSPGWHFWLLAKKGVNFMVCELKKETPLEISSIPKISLFTDDVQLAQSAKLAGQSHKHPFWSFGLELQPRLRYPSDVGCSARTPGMLCVWTCTLGSLSLGGRFSNLSFLLACTACCALSFTSKSKHYLTWLCGVSWVLSDVPSWDSFFNENVFWWPTCHWVSWKDHWVPQNLI